MREREREKHNYNTTATNSGHLAQPNQGERVRERERERRERETTLPLLLTHIIWHNQTNSPHTKRTNAAACSLPNPITYTLSAVPPSAAATISPSAEKFTTVMLTGLIDWQRPGPNRGIISGT